MDLHVIRQQGAGVSNVLRRFWGGDETNVLAEGREGVLTFSSEDEFWGLFFEITAVSNQMMSLIGLRLPPFGIR